MLVSSPHESLTVSALNAIDAIDRTWQPATAENRPISKNYLIVFRSRRFLNTEPPEYTTRITALMTEEKIEKTLKLLNSAISDNQFDAHLFRLRSIVFINFDQAVASVKDLHKAMVRESKFFR